MTTPDTPSEQQLLNRRRTQALEAAKSILGEVWDTVVILTSSNDRDSKGQDTMSYCTRTLGNTFACVKMCESYANVTNTNFIHANARNPRKPEDS